MLQQNYSKKYMYRRIVDAKMFIDRYYQDDIDITNIAEEACFSKFHFLRLFKKTYGVTPYQYLTAVRIGKAKELLQKNISITQTCRSLGFESLSSFNKLFRRHTKQAPSAYAAAASQLRVAILGRPIDHIPICFIEYMGWKK